MSTLRSEDRIVILGKRCVLMGMLVGVCGCANQLPKEWNRSQLSSPAIIKVKPSQEPLPLTQTTNTALSDSLRANNGDVQTPRAVSPTSHKVVTVSHTMGLVQEAEMLSFSPAAYEPSTADKAVTIEQLEAIAFANNPTLRQHELLLQKARAHLSHVGRKANPVIGYQVMQLADEGTDQHTAFIDQEFVTADKLAMNRQVLQQSVRAQQWEFESQRLRIQTDLRRAFSKALAAQKRLELISEFEVVAAKGVELAELRRAASEGSQVDVLQARIQLQEVQLSKNQTNIALSSSWRELAAISGVETLQTSTLLGTLAEEPVEISWSDYTQQLLAGSPEYQVAQTQLQESLAVLQRQEVQAIPNWQVQLAAGKDNGTDSGMMNLQVGIPIPLHHANRGLIAAARADYCHAQQELQRVQQSIAARVARVSEEYDAARLAVLRYRNEIVPNALQTLELAEAAYTAGESSFLEVLIVRKTYFDSNLQRLNAEEQFAVAKASIDGSLLTGALDASIDRSRDTSLRDATFNQQ